MAFANFEIRCNKYLNLVKNDDVMDLIVVFCILFVFMLVLYCFCVATEFSVNKDLYKVAHVINQQQTMLTTFQLSKSAANRSKDASACASAYIRTHTQTDKLQT